MRSPRRSIVSVLRSASTATKLLLVCVLVLLTAVGTALAAAQVAKPGIAMQISPISRSIEQGQSAGFTVSVTSTGGFVGAVALSVDTKNLPGGASATLAPATVTPTSGSTATSTVTVTTAASTPVGSYYVTVYGVSGKVTGTVTAGLTVTAPVTSSFSMAVTPASVTMAPGSTAVYTIQLSRTRFAGAVAFAISGGLPAGATATFTPSSTTENSSTLQITTASSTLDGTYPVNIVGSGQNANGTVQKAYASAQLVISTTGKPFTISGNVGGLLSPGTSRSLDLTLTNPNKKPLSVSNLTVTVQSVTRTAAAIAGNMACTSADYAVTQYSGPYPLTVPGSGSTSLSALNVSPSKWPKVAMLNTATNQDGCKNATVTLSYSGSGSGS